MMMIVMTTTYLCWGGTRRTKGRVELAVVARYAKHVLYGAEGAQEGGVGPHGGQGGGWGGGGGALLGQGGGVLGQGVSSTQVQEEQEEQEQGQGEQGQGSLPSNHGEL